MSARERVAERVRAVTGLAGTPGLEARITSLEVAVRENADLAVPLTALVGGLERDVAEVLARRHGRGMGA
ncbi:hypothetical protein [Nocardioides zeicaulis]|uniref:Uncharacterized protein n=1 Tax=Nocardioides zeicaulis TaxID=1776857 RepID=A0ABV6E5Q2_9ACTN